MKKFALYSVFIGLFVLLMSWSILWCIEIVQDAFTSNSIMGWCAVTGFGSVIGGMLYLLTCEFRGYLSVRRVDALAKSLQEDDVTLARKYAMKWLKSMSQPERVVMVEQATSVEIIRNILSPVIEEIDSKTDICIAKESLLTGAVVGISPWPLIDGIVVAWRQLRLMRAIAIAYGVRPGTLGTLRLLKSVVFSVALADASEHVMQWISVKIPSMGGIIPSAGQAVATAVLTARLGKSCKLACRPIKVGKGKSSNTFSKMKCYFKKTAAKEKSTRCGLSATRYFSSR